MANTGNISMAPQLAAIAAQITVVDGIVDDILEDTGTTLPGEHAAIGVVTDAILVDTETTLPGEHVVLAAEHGIIDGNVDNILVDTDVTIPALIAAKNIRGNLITFPGYDGIPGDTAYHDALNLTDETGKLMRVQCYCATTGGSVRITIDGNAYVVAVASDTIFDIDFTIASAGVYIFATSAQQGNLNIEFGTSLRLEIKQTNGANNMRCLGLYISDE